MAKAKKARAKAPKVAWLILDANGSIEAGPPSVTKWEAEALLREFLADEYVDPGSSVVKYVRADAKEVG